MLLSFANDFLILLSIDTNEISDATDATHVTDAGADHREFLPFFFTSANFCQFLHSIHHNCQPNRQ
jgi:hypothetical protein